MKDAALPSALQSTLDSDGGERFTSWQRSEFSVGVWRFDPRRRRGPVAQRYCVKAAQVLFPSSPMECDSKGPKKVLVKMFEKGTCNCRTVKNRQLQEELDSLRNGSCIFTIILQQKT